MKPDGGAHNKNNKKIIRTTREKIKGQRGRDGACVYPKVAGPNVSALPGLWIKS